MTRPGRVVLVAGTGTEVGKTWFTVQMAIEASRRGLVVAARKLAQSFEASDDPAGTDAALLGAAVGCAPHEVCPPHRWYPVAMAPPMAAEALGRPPVRLAELLEELAWGDGADLGFVETAGGVRSPQAEDGDVVDLLARLRPEAVVLVAHAGLGTLNDVRLSVSALGQAGLGLPVAVALNRYDAREALHVRNRDWLAERFDLDVSVTPSEVVDRLTR